jgi:hypothetical protein
MEIVVLMSVHYETIARLFVKAVSNEVWVHGVKLFSPFLSLQF